MLILSHPPAPPDRPRGRKRRCDRLLPRIPLHRRLLPQENPWSTHLRRRPIPPRGRRRRQPTPPARAGLHARGQVRRPDSQTAGDVQDPLRQLNGQGGDRVREVRVRVYERGRRGYTGADCEFLGDEVAYVAVGGGGRVQGVVFGVSPVWIRRSQ